MKPLRSALVLAVAVLATGGTAAQTATVYRCPNNVYTSSAEITPKQADERGCKPIQAAPVTVVQSPRPRGETARPVPPAAGATAAPGANVRVDPADQRSRDSDARRILETELRREEERLAAMQREYNNGNPERLGEERNYQKYLDRVAEMKAGIARKEADMAAIRRELAKLPPS